MAKQARKPAPVSAPAPVTSVSPWTPNDRNGEVSRSTLREMSVRATLGLPVDPDLLASVLDLVEDALMAADTATGGAVTLDELPGEIRQLEESRRESAEAEEESTRDLKKQISDLEDAAEVAARDLAVTADEWKRRAGLAEHNLAESVRNGHALDREAAEWAEAGQQAIRDLAELRRILRG